MVVLVLVLVVVISPPSIFTLRSLRLLASPVKSDGCATSGFLLCVHYAFIIMCLGRSPSWFIERSCVDGGRNPRCVDGGMGWDGVVVHLFFYS